MAKQQTNKTEPSTPSVNSSTTENPPVEQVSATATMETPPPPPTHQEDEMLTPTEVARRIGRHPSTIGRWIEDGLLKATRLPSGLWVVRASEVNKFLGGSAIDSRV